MEEPKALFTIEQVLMRYVYLLCQVYAPEFVQSGRSDFHRFQTLFKLFHRLAYELMLVFTILYPVYVNIKVVGLANVYDYL